jgi:hypothetical protein
MVCMIIFCSSGAALIKAVTCSFIRNDGFKQFC